MASRSRLAWHSSQAFRSRSRSCFIASVVYGTSFLTAGFSRDETSQKYEGILQGLSFASFPVFEQNFSLVA